MLLGDFSRGLDELLHARDFDGADSALNGLQVGRADRELKKAAFAVDACMESFRRAKAWGADVLVVHHGIFWGRQAPITGAFHDRLAFLLGQGLGLYASHLPLDAHPDLGNNIGLARELGLTEVQPFGVYHGRTIGMKGRLPRPLRVEEVSEKLFGDDRGTLGRLPFGKDKIETVGIISGGATMDVHQAIAEGLDCYITGESGHTVYHDCLEAGIHVIFGGHYRTEVWGVANLARWTREQWGLETCFLDLPTGY